jgi:purine-binding chemotaxis protein CheW
MSVATAAQIVTFRLGDDLFAADINDVERVLRYSEPTPVPNVPDWVQGVIEYRSRVVPVIDLRVRFALDATAPSNTTRLMVLSSEGEWIAAVVDAVLEVVPLGDAQLAPPPPLFKGMSAEFLRGILRRNDRLIIVLDIERLLATRERLEFDRALLASVPVVPQAPAGPTPTPEPTDAAVHEPETDVGSTMVAPSDDFVIIRGSHDPATSPLEAISPDPIPEAAGQASLPMPGADDPGFVRPAVPMTPEWGTPPAPRPASGDADDPEGGQSDG